MLLKGRWLSLDVAEFNGIMQLASAVQLVTSLKLESKLV